MDSRGRSELQAEAKAACAAWLAVLLERTSSGQIPIAGLDDPNVNEDRSATEDRAAIYEAENPNSFDVWHSVTDAEPSAVLESLLRRVADAVRGKDWESRFWSCVFAVVPTRFPDDIAEDLIDRDVNIDHLGHLQLSDRLLWRLAERVPEALATLATRRFTDPEYDVDAFEEVLHGFPHEESMFRAVVYCQPSSRDKADRFAEYLRRLESPGQWLEAARAHFLEKWAVDRG
ncbi:MAG: hypothetical protein AAFV77_12510 [Planctomycetota bacterium]